MIPDVRPVRSNIQMHYFQNGPSQICRQLFRCCFDAIVRRHSDDIA